VQIGVLALQGDFEKHEEMLLQMEVDTLQVRYPEQLSECAGLIIPGGESTTLTKQIDYCGMRNPLLDFGSSKPIFGTCAGMIMLAQDVDDHRVEPLGLIDISVLRNGWGRQVHSSTERLNLLFDEPTFDATFIRAPSVESCGSNIQVLSEFDGKPVFVSNGLHIACSFHPELGTDFRIHKYFIGLTNV